MTCAFHRGTLTAIVGPNGAGKTTYFNLISGQLRPTGRQREPVWQGHRRPGAPQRTRLGLGRAFQLINLIRAYGIRRRAARGAIRRANPLGFLSIAARNTVVRDEARHWLDRVKLTPQRSI